MEVFLLVGSGGGGGEELERWMEEKKVSYITGLALSCRGFDNIIISYVFVFENLPYIFEWVEKIECANLLEWLLFLVAFFLFSLAWYG